MRSVITHGHIFKNAGSTLDWALKRVFDRGFCDHRDDMLMRRQGADYLQVFLNENKHLNAISSHHMCSATSIKHINIIPVNLIRHPIERVRSVYNFERLQKADTPGAIAAKKYCFCDYIRWRLEPNVNRTIRDYQTFYLAGKHTVRAMLPTDIQVLSKALEYLGKVFCVGIVDRYDDSMVVFEEYLSQFFPQIDLSYIRQNTSNYADLDLNTKIQGVLNEIGKDGCKLIEENTADILIYKFSNQTLDEKIQRIVGFEEKLIRFKERCARLS